MSVHEMTDEAYQHYQTLHLITESKELHTNNLTGTKIIAVKTLKSVTSSGLKIKAPTYIQAHIEFSDNIPITVIRFRSSKSSSCVEPTSLFRICKSATKSCHVSLSV